MAPPLLLLLAGAGALALLFGRSARADAGRPAPASGPASWPRPLSAAERDKLLGGPFTWKPAPSSRDPDAIAIDPGWVSRELVQLETPELARFGYPRLTVHRRAREPLRALLDAWTSAGLLDRISSIAGTWVPRHQRGKDALSSHAYGIALDLNAPQNPFGRPPAPVGAPGSVLELVPIAEALGWAWGGRWKTPDPHHFELAAIPSSTV